ncbi:MAG: DUF4870 domain-containing protein [Candidatus Poseidoniales archaeon]|nr:MAG: DUF4870 domain-containing protein [Candidatus Poseidoniales archaeon]RCH72493.1 MAG: DUF4870 domain-containing protein [Candidatus Poseidoniales archaeon]
MDERPPVVHLGGKTPDRAAGTLSHILGPITGFLAPLIIYAIRSPNLKEEDPLLESHLVESLNASLTFLIALIIHSFLMMLCIGFVTFIAHWILYMVWAINANSALQAGREYRYPFTYRFLV